MVKKFAANMAATPHVTPVNAVPGLPGAQCFERTADSVPATDPQSWQRIQWHFKCIAQAGRYAFTTYSDTETDVKQQISAQYRILAGE